MAKKKDVLSQKRAELNTYINQFNSAISMVTNTIASLSSINDGIAQKIKEIDEYQAELDTTKTGLVIAKDQNERVIQNFNALLNIEPKE